MPFIIRPTQPEEDTGFQEHITEMLHELRLPKNTKFSSREQAEEAACMLKEQTCVKWEVTCA